MDKPDVVVVDFPHAGVLVPERIDAASVMFTHNVEAEIFERHAARAKGLWRMIWANQSRKMIRFEGDTLRRFDSVIAVSKRDADALSKRYELAQVEEIDTGVDLDFFAAAPPGLAPDPGSDGGTLVFTATMSWAANVEGIHFLLDEVWPSLVAARPRINAVIIGRDPPASLSDKIRQRSLNVTLTGFVDDIRPYVAESHVYVIPLWVGSGNNADQGIRGDGDGTAGHLDIPGDRRPGCHGRRTISCGRTVPRHSPAGILSLLDDAAFAAPHRDGGRAAASDGRPFRVEDRRAAIRGDLPVARWSRRRVERRA